MSGPTPEPSYRALFAVPQLGRVVASMQSARIAQSMFGVAIVLFALAEYDSPALAGIVTFASIFLDSWSRRSPAPCSIGTAGSG